MGLACGIVGLPNVGKSTIFNAITAAGAENANYPFCTIEPNVGVVDVPDPRLEVLSRYIESKETVPAALRVVDIAGLVAGASRGEGLGNKFLGHIKDVDAILHVVRCFEKEDVIHVHGGVDPRRDVEEVDLELGLADAETLARNIERAAKKARSGDKEAQALQDLFERAREHLASGRPLRAEDWDRQAREHLAPLCLLTLKPVLFVGNVGDDDFEGASASAQTVREIAAETGAESVFLCGDLEGELMAMPPEERAPFQEELGLAEPGLFRLIRGAYTLLGLQTFFTANANQIHAWNIARGTPCAKAAGAVHSDFEEGFIRAEVFSVDELVAHENLAGIKAAGKLRVEGRDYVMQEGDVAFFHTSS